MAAAAAERRCLSDLPDDALRRILFFAPAREGATTAVLARRWRWLWRTCGAVNLDTRSVKRQDGSRIISTKEREGFVRTAGEALAAAAAAAPITRLSVVNAACSRIHPTDVQNWSSLPPGAAVFLPQLAELHLEGCTVPLVDVQRIIDAAPLLGTLHLESCYMPKEFNHGRAAPPVQCCRLVFPAVAALVFARCIYGAQILEIDAPGLRYFRYQGSVQHSNKLSLKPQKAVASLARVDLDLTDDHNYYTAQSPVELFWWFIRNFSTAKVLKIQLHFAMDHMGIGGERNQDELLGGLSFSLLERLELQAQYDPESVNSMVMLANLFHCCPVVRDLRLKLSTVLYSAKRYSVDKKVLADYKSVDRFRNRRSPIVSLGGEDDDGNHEAPYIHGLSDESFDCLQKYLKRVSLHFYMEEPNCLGVELAKFFAKKAMVLEEMYIDDGSQKICEHMNTSVGRSLANNSAETKNFRGITVLPR